MAIREITKSELPRLVNLHYEVLPNEFLTSISKSFLLGFYQNLFSSPNSHFFGIFESPNPPILSIVNYQLSIPLIAAIVCLEEKYKPQLSSYLLLFLKNLPKFLISPKSLISLIQSFLFKFGQKQKTEVFFIGVSKSYQGKGLGKKLITALIIDLPQEYQGLSVDCKCKLPSNNFYKSLGFKVKKTFRLYNEDWNRYEKPIR
jgi:ribosomal protein S18 acetylase RimI-like enzyme